MLRRASPLLLAVALAGAPAPLAAQAAGQQDTLQVDSTRVRILDRFRVLSKPPGVDSTLMIDTLALQRQREAQQRASASAPSDTIMAALLELAGYSATQYSGVKARFATSDERLVLEGGEGTPARLQQPDQTLTATDTITYDDPAGLVWTAGATTTERPREEPVESESIIYSMVQDRGTAHQARTRFQQGSTWLMEGDLPWIVPDTVFGHHILFTSCQEEHPHYHFAAREAKVIGGSWLVVRNVTLNFADVPVLWLPFIFQNTESGRSSGILTPRFSINDVVRTSRGATRRISNLGFYWAINDYADATVAMDWWSDNFFSVTGGGRYNIRRQFLDGQFNYRQFWRSEGGDELTFDTRHNWRISERTQFAMSARYASSASFVRENSFDPREVTQSIDSQGGLNRRFDWGSLSLNANRRQFLSDDRVEMTFPQVNLSLKPITLFRAPPSRSGFFNNMTWSGSANARRSTTDRAELAADETFTFGAADSETTSAGLSSSLNAGALRFSQSMNFSEMRTLDVPLGVLDSTFVSNGSEMVQDVASANLSWNMSLDYQQRIIGTTTLTPTLNIDGSAKRDDQDPLAQNFVSAPTRLSFGAQLKSDIYGLWGGIGSFERIRHKITPGVSYQYAPGVVPTDLQERVFGARELEARNVITLSVNQTFEAKRRASQQPDTTAFQEDDPFMGLGMDQPFDVDADSLALARARQDSIDTARAADRRAVRDADPNAPRRVEQGEIVNLLSLRTSAVTYDFTRAAQDSAVFADGFTTTRLQNQVGSDFLRGLSVSVEHELFDTDDLGARSFDPHLSQLNLSFQMSNSSGIVRALGGLLGGGGDSEGPTEERLEEEEEDLTLDDVEGVPLTDESSIVPGAGGNDLMDPATNQPRRRRQSSVGAWSAGLQYSLTRPRNDQLASVQMVQANFRFRPTEKWEMSWRTSFDVERQAFNDHTIRLTRDLHRWEANFDFLQTATGNWSFRFQVSLSDNRDLKFDYEQRALDRNGTF